MKIDVNMESTCKDDTGIAYDLCMTRLPADGRPTLDVDDVVALEQAIAAAGTPLSELMHLAGASVAQRVQELLVDAATQVVDPAVAILCGNGNNGGDGWVAAKLLALAGAPVHIVCARLPEGIKAQPAHDAATASLETLKTLGGRILSEGDAFGPAPSIIVDADGKQLDLAHQALEQATVVVDAILGTGFEGTPRSPFLEWIAAANETRTGRTVLAVDVPSGVSARTGNASSPCIIADETLTMIVPKPGLSASFCGQVSIAPLVPIEPFIEL